MLDEAGLESALSGLVPGQLAHDLVESYIEMRRDVATGTLGRSAPGKFVETVVQSLEQLETGSFESHPAVDQYLKGVESRTAVLDEDLRIAVARVARGMYTLRNKRNIAHKGTVDPNLGDLRYLLAGAQWIMSEFLRRASNVSMQEATRLIDMIQTPVGAAVEDFGTHKLVLRDLTIRDELLVLLHATHPQRTPVADLLKSTARRAPTSVRKVLRQMWDDKLVDGDARIGYWLTAKGVDAAVRVISAAA